MVLIFRHLMRPQSAKLPEEDRMPKSKPAASHFETELCGLTTTQANLLARQTALATDVEAAVARRREFLISGTNAARLAEVERTCRELEGTAFDITDALSRGRAPHHSHHRSH